MKKVFLGLAVLIIALGAWGLMAEEPHHVRAELVSVNGSSVRGHVSLVQLPHGGALITVEAAGLKPNGAFVSLYYDNNVCDLEPYSEDDIVGTYTGNKAGIGTAVGRADDDLDEI